MSKKLKSLIIAGLIVGALSVGGISVFASSVNTTNATTTQNSDQGMCRDGGCGFGFRFGTQDFSSLVTKGIIDQATADKMTAFMGQYKTNMQAEMDKVKAMSDADRKAYFASKKDTMDPYAQMVSQGIITQAQLDAIKAAMPTKGDGMGFREGRGFGNKFNVSNLVTQGVIDQATADKITAYMDQKEKAEEANKSDMKAMTPEEKKAYFANNKTQRVDILTDMVNNGVITQDQANAIKAAMPVKAHSTNQNSTN